MFKVIKPIKLTFFFQMSFFPTDPLPFLLKFGEDFNIDD